MSGGAHGFRMGGQGGAILAAGIITAPLALMLKESARGPGHGQGKEQKNCGGNEILKMALGVIRLIRSRLRGMDKTGKRRPIDRQGLRSSKRRVDLRPACLRLQGRKWSNGKGGTKMCRPPDHGSGVEEDRLVTALNADIELVGIVANLFGNQRVAAICRHEIEYLVFRIRGFILEIDAREKMGQHAA